MTRAAPLAALLALTLPATPAEASEPEMCGMGARSGAMAGTGVADSAAYDSTYTNPAGLMEPARRRLSLGYIAARYRLRMDGAARDVENTNGAILGAALPLPFGGVLKDRLALGLAFYFPTSVLNRARAPYPDEARLALLDTRTQVVSATAALAARIHPRLTVGAGVLVLATLIGEIRIAPDAGGRITTLAEEQITVAYTPIIGVRVRVLPSLRVGAVFRGVSKAEYDIRIANSLGNALPIEIPTLHVAGVAQYDPLQIALEGAWRVRPFLGITVGATWKRWSDYPNASANAAPGTPPQPSPGYHDTVVPRVAVELSRDFSSLRLHGRAGYLFEWSPAPGDAPALLDADRHVATVGGALEWSHRFGVLQVDLFGQWHQLAGSPRASGGFYVLGGTVGVDL